MRRGFTVLEIMIALVVMGIGIVALFSLQAIAIGGNIAAAEMTQATALAERWAERLRRDTIGWTGSVLPESLRRQGVWLDATAQMVNKDFVSQSEDPDVLDPRYCVKYRVATVPPGDPDPRVLRVEVRVVWPRQDRAMDRFLDCPTEMMEPNNLRNTWQVPVPTLLYRHVGPA